MNKDDLKNKLSSLIDEILDFDDESLGDSLLEIEETEGKWNDVRDYLLSKGYHKDLLDEVDSEMWDRAGAISYVSELEKATQNWNGPEVLSDYLVEKKIDLANKYYNIWKLHLEALKNEIEVEDEYEDGISSRRP